MNQDDLKIFKPQVLGDNDNAGGQRTLNAIESSLINELHQGISDIDHAQSAIDIAKCFPGVNTADTTALNDAHVFFSEPPADPLVSSMLVESPDLDDESRMTDLREIIQSSVTPGELARNGMPGFLANQNSFSRDYLTSIHELNNVEYRKFYNLNLGQVIAITVEYEGPEDGAFPRFNHFAQVTEITPTNIVFQPTIPKATPEASRLINGEDRCTKLRLVNSANNIVFHGVSKLTAAASGKILNVAETAQNLVPAITTEQVKVGLSISGSSDSDTVGKTITQGATTAQTYVFDVDDLLTGTNIAVDYAVKLSYTSGGIQRNQSDAIINVVGNQISVTITYAPDAGTFVSITYLSTEQLANYASADPFPADEKLVRGTISGTVEHGDGYVFTSGIREEPQGLYVGHSRCGIVDYDNGSIVLDPGYSNLVFYALVSKAESSNSTSFVLDAQEPKLASLYLQVETVAGDLISASSDAAGVITGTSISGSISSKLVVLAFTVPVKLSTLRYDVIETLSLLPPADIYNLDPLRIPNAGRVDIFHKWKPIAVQHTIHQGIASPAIGQTHNVRAGTDFIEITDSDSVSLWTATNDHYSVNKETGLVTLNSDFSGFNGPFILSDTVRELNLVVDKGDNTLSLAQDLGREYPEGSTVASVQVLGELQARVGQVRDMTAWVNDWDQDGDPATAGLNVVDNPIEVTNDAAINEEWVLIFSSDTAFRCVGKRVGQVAVGDTLNDFSPINPATNKPFFTIRSAAFGAGWQQGEAVRFPTIAASRPIMPVRITQAGHSNITKDRAILVFAGNES